MRMKTGISHYKKLFKEIDRGGPERLYLFKGQERFIMEELSARIVRSVTGEEMQSFNLLVEYGSEVDIESFISTANSYPFLGDRRILVLREMERMRGGWKHLLEYCRDPAPTSVIILQFVTHDDSGRKIRPPRDYSAVEKAVEANGRIVRFDTLRDEDLRRWIRQKASRMGVELDDAAAAAIVGSIGGNLYDIQNELDKLSLVYEGESAGVEEVGKVIGRYRLNAVWDLIEGIGRKGEAEILGLLSNIINSGAERPSVVVYLLIRHFLTLLSMKTGGEKGGYGFRGMREKAERIGTREILIWLENLRLAEIIMKSISFPEDMLIESAILHSMKGRLMEAPGYTAAAYS